MHRGTVFIITKDENNKFKVEKSTEFNGGMGLNCFGKVIYDMLKNFKEPLLFDLMIRDFDERHFKYNDDVMTYVADSQEAPFIDENKRSFFEYSLTNNQFKFFCDNNEQYIYTSDSNYIKNLSDEDIEVVCSNGVFKVKPQQIIVTDYDECINNSKMSFGEKIDEDIVIDSLEEGSYIPTLKQKMILENVIKTLESFGYKVSLYGSNGMNNGIEIETWTTGGVNMLHLIQFDENFIDIYDINKINKQIEEIADNFSVDEEIDIHRQADDYRQFFSIKSSLEDFEEYEKDLEKMAKKFLDKYHEISYEKFLENMKKEESKDEINY